MQQKLGHTTTCRKNNSLEPLQYVFSGSFLICLNDIILGGNWHPDKDLAWLLERHSISWNNPFASKTSIIHSTISLYTSHFSQNGQKYGKKMKKYENLGRCVLELDLMPGSLQILVSSFFVFGNLGSVIFFTLNFGFALPVLPCSVLYVSY